MRKSLTEATRYHFIPVTKVKIENIKFCKNVKQLNTLTVDVKEKQDSQEDSFVFSCLSN